MKRMTLFAGAMLLMLIAVTGVASAEEYTYTCGDPIEYPLYAGQDIYVGQLSVSNDETNLIVEYIITEEDWYLTETHLDFGWIVPEGDSYLRMEGTGKNAVEVTYNSGDVVWPQGILHNGNPAPGQFTYSSYYDAVEKTLTVTYVIPFEDLWFNVDDYPCMGIAAHAVVEKVICEAPYCAYQIIEANQGLASDESPVAQERSNPDQALNFETTKATSSFYSLGFGGNITLEFACPITNGEGDDIQVIEDTWGLPYPNENASVYASNDGLEWTYLGEAGNQIPYDMIHTISTFDLGDLTSAKYIKLVDTTPRAGFESIYGDGYDLNAVCALHDYVQDETAWAAQGDPGTNPFDGKNWATYVQYCLQPCLMTVSGEYFIGYGDNGGDGDYNDFGMKFFPEEIYVYDFVTGDYYLTEATYDFTAMVHIAGWNHQIHFERPVTGDFTYDLSRSDEAMGSETVNVSGVAGPIDVILYDDAARWTGNVNPAFGDENVTITIVVENENEANVWDDDPAWLRTFIATDTTEFTDLDALWNNAQYDPWMNVVSGTIAEIDITKVDDTTVPVTPFILVIPNPEWQWPTPDSTPVTTPYPDFDDYYSDGTPENWYV